MVELLHKDLTSEIIAAAFEVSNNLGAGFLERVYENSLRVELEIRGLVVETQKQVRINYKGREVGLYQTDLLVNDSVIVEVKSTEQILSIHKAQLINYLKATGLQVGLIVNFGNPKVEFERIALSDKRYQKKNLYI